MRRSNPTFRATKEQEAGNERVETVLSQKRKAPHANAGPSRVTDVWNDRRTHSALTPPQMQCDTDE